MAKFLLKEAEQRIINEDNDASIDQNSNADFFTDTHTFKYKNNDAVQLTGANFLSQTQLMLEESNKFANSPDKQFKWVMQYATNIIESNKELFKNEPELKNAFNNYINAYTKNLNMDRKNIGALNDIYLNI